VIHSDGALAAQDFTLETARVVREGGPWGQAFPEPTFDGRFSVVETRILGDRHLKLKLRASGDSGRGGTLCEAIAFRYFDHAEAADVSPGQQVEIAFRMDVNEYAGTERLQLLIEHLDLAE
jgi:single-stranded-DNA-specific exonuclease